MFGTTLSVELKTCIYLNMIIRMRNIFLCKRLVVVLNILEKIESFVANQTCRLSDQYVG